MADIDRDPEQAEQTEQTEQVPFFARFLEDQKRVRTGVKAGKLYTTLKYPSDKEDGGGGGDVTLKYPSDSDEEIYLK
ncbi:microviridin/marinostatin family tricyclic proteinase inhibitor [Sorangium sp. So ce1024]|uniref:microviridin/marinostatin family tricyclic proteinase inhibitor n=1 Tax=unclassified Sorangium TaxID=2621164 RepID=UPI003F0F029C